MSEREGDRKERKRDKTVRRTERRESERIFISISITSLFFKNHQLDTFVYQFFHKTCINHCSISSDTSEYETFLSCFAGWV